MTALFSDLDLEDPSVERHVGFRLHRLEVLNWGTFHRQVWGFEPTGSTALLTGDIGSGKSTLVDALTTLLVPAQRITYNKAAGATTRERDLRSYVQGYYKSERSEATGSSRPVGLRTDGSSHSVVLAVFRNAGLDVTVTLAQVFWLRPGAQGQPERFYAVADQELSIRPDFVEFGADTERLRRRLRQAGVRVHRHFPEYAADYRRQLGIESPQAVELFHQTVSMKSVSDLTGFVRGHMLEPFDAAAAIDTLVQHFDDLTRAHDAVMTARAQLAALQPLVRQCETYDELTAAIEALHHERDALSAYVKTLTAHLLQERITVWLAESTTLQSTRASRAGALAQRRRRAQELEIERAGYGGDRLALLERRIEEDSAERDRRRRRRAAFDADAGRAGLGLVADAGSFAALRQAIGAAADEASARRTDGDDQLKDLLRRQGELDADLRDLREEMASLRRSQGNLPRQQLEVRLRLSAGTGVPIGQLPFAGELIQVRPEAGDWEGAAERVLRGFALSMLVPQQHYEAVSTWIDRNHLGLRLVYHRVPAQLAPASRGAQPPRGARLRDVLQIRDESPMYSWLDRELDTRADHILADDMATFRRSDKAVTRAGQVRVRGRHEKDDTTRIDDRRRYVLGWSSERKVEALLDQARRLDADRRALAQALAQEDAHRRALDDRLAALRRLADVEDYAEIDWEGVVARITEAERERREIEASSRDLERVTSDLVEVQREVERLDSEIRHLDVRIGEVGGALRADESRLGELEAELAHAEPSPDVVVALAARAADTTLSTPEDVARWETATRGTLTAELDSRHDRRQRVTSRIVGLMSDFRAAYPTASSEMDAAVEAAGEYRRLRDQLVHDDLPRFESDFRTYLRTNTVREIAGFQSRLLREVDLIQRRIDRINESLHAIDYNPGRFIRLEPQPTPSVEVRDFRAELRACTDNAITATDDEEYAETTFLAVKRIIERFRGRTGQTDADRAWTARVTDVRNWFTFAASERWRADGSEHETYSDSGGKSGGQKEKLAYTILAASLAYQFRLEWGVSTSRTFRFVVIDEAFGRGSDESTRYALSLFRKLGLQLVIVTPLQKIPVIEPFVAAVGFVDNRTGQASRLQTLTIEEYRERRDTHARGRALVAEAVRTLPVGGE